MKFAFIFHPIDLEDITKRIKPFRLLPGAMAEGIIRHLPVFKAAEITGVRSPSAETEGWFIACPLTSRQMLGLSHRLRHQADHRGRQTGCSG